MKYALGNMLNGAGGFNPDGLSLDLQFATDKTLTARKGPTPVFTRASTATFVGSDGLIQSAAINGARFDHDPVTLDCNGLLIEESRTNLVFPSDTLTTQTRTVTAVAHTLSFYGTGTVALSGVAIATVAGTGAYPTRTTITFTPTAGSLIMTVTGSVTQAQLEAGNFPTSYIPTTTASLIRSADVCSITGSAFTSFFGSSPAAFTWNASFNHLPAETLQVNIRAIADFANGGNRRWIYGDANANNTFQGKYFEVTNNVNMGAASSYPYKIAMALTPTSNFFSVNGATAGSGVTSGALLNSVTGSQFGQTGSCHFQYIKGFKKRLSNAKLQALTA